MSESATEARQRPHNDAERRLVLSLAVFAAAVFLIVQEGGVNNYDGRTMYEVAEAIVDRGTIAISGEWSTLPGGDGQHFGRYGLGLSLVSAVPYIASLPVAALAGHRHFVTSAAVSSLTPFVAAALVAALCLLARRIGAGVVAALIVAIGAAVGTFMLPYTKEFYSEPLATLCLVIAIERALADSARRPRRTRWLISLSARLPVSLLLGLRVIARRPRRVLLGVASVAVTVSGIVVVLAARAAMAANWEGPASLDPEADRANQILLVITIVLVGMAAINAIVITWAAALDFAHSSALTRAVGATPGQVSAGLSVAQVLPALAGALLGVLAGLALWEALSNDEAATPTVWQLLAVIVGAALVVAALSAIRPASARDAPWRTSCDLSLPDARRRDEASWLALLRGPRPELLPDYDSLLRAARLIAQGTLLFRVTRTGSTA